MKRILIALASLAGVAILVMAIALGINHFAGANKNNSGDEQVETPAQEAQRLMRLDLTIPADSEWLDIVKSSSGIFSDESMPWRAAERVATTGFSDAVSFPFSATAQNKSSYSEAEAAAMLLEAKKEAITNPVLGFAIGDFFTGVTFADGTTLLDCNPWLSFGQNRGIDTVLTARSVYRTRYGIELPASSDLLPQWREEHPSAPDPTEEEWMTVRDANGDKVIYVSDEYLDYINKVLLLMDRFILDGVQFDWNTAKHCFLNTATVRNDVRVIWNTNPEYRDSKPVLALSYVRKDGVKEVRFGFNLIDKRIEVFDKVVTPPSDTKKPPKDEEEIDDPPIIPPVIPPTEEEEDDDPPVTPPPTDEPQTKDPWQDPVNKGNTDRGGGQNDPQNNEDPHQKEDPVNDKTQGHRDPSTTFPETPPQDDSHKNTPVNKVDENKDDYEPEDSNQSTTWTAPSGESFNYSPSTNSSNNGENNSGGGTNNPQPGGTDTGSTNQGSIVNGEMAPPD